MQMMSMQAPQFEMLDRGSAMENMSFGAAMNSAPVQKKKESKTTTVGGKKKMNDEMSSKLYKLSKM